MEPCDDCTTCARCGKPLCRNCHPEDGWNTVDAELYCDDCTRVIIAENRDLIAEYVAAVAITGRIHWHDPAHRFAPTPEAYAAGDREAYTENSVRAFNRHERTNYDDIVRDLDRDDALDRAIYEAVRARVEELLAEAEPVGGEPDEDDGEGVAP